MYQNHVGQTLLVVMVAIGLCHCSDEQNNSLKDSSVADQLIIASDSNTTDAAVDLRADSIVADQGLTNIRLPGDESPHADPMEWWYYTGKLQTKDNQTYGFEFVFFQAMHGSFPGYLAQFTITDLQKGTFSIDAQTSLVDQRGATSGFDLKIGDWTLQGHDGKDKLSAAMTTSSYAINLELTAQKPVVFHYGTGEMFIGSTKPFYYYSYPRMAVVGTITVDGTEHDVTGTAWMDHQWGDYPSDFGEYGWDWFSARLDDQSEVMLFVVRHNSDNKITFSGGTIIEPDGSYTALRSEDFSISSTATWQSPHNNADYPQDWQIQIPSRKLEMTITPLMQDQEYYMSILGSPIYWEGLCDLTAKKDGKTVGGHAYVELLGYAPIP